MKKVTAVQSAIHESMERGNAQIEHDSKYIPQSFGKYIKSDLEFGAHFLGSVAPVLVDEARVKREQ